MAHTWTEGLTFSLSREKALPGTLIEATKNKKKILSFFFKTYHCDYRFLNSKVTFTFGFIVNNLT